MKKWQFPYISRMGRMYTIPLSILLFATSLQEPYLTNLVEFLLGLKKSFFHKKNALICFKQRVSHASHDS